VTDKLIAAITAINNAPKASIGNKQYSMVATRVEMFRLHFGVEYGLMTELLDTPDINLVRVRAVITDPNDRMIASGLAEEDRRVGRINQTSAVENAETSAIGRALAALGLHGGEYASDVEMMMVGQMGDVEVYDEAGDMVRDIPTPQSNGLSHRQVPKAVPISGLPLPDMEVNETWNNPHPIADKILQVVGSITDRDQLAAYWNELKSFRHMLEQQAPDRLSELKAAFQTQFDYVEIK
jgi:hypothetical protein